MVQHTLERDFTCHSSKAVMQLCPHLRHVLIFPAIFLSPTYTDKQQLHFTFKALQSADFFKSLFHKNFLNFSFPEESSQWVTEEDVSAQLRDKEDGALNVMWVTDLSCGAFRGLAEACKE